MWRTCCQSRCERWCASANRADDPRWRCRSWAEDASPSGLKWPIGASCIALADVSAYQTRQITWPLAYRQRYSLTHTHTRSLCKSEKNHGSAPTHTQEPQMEKKKKKKREAVSIDLLAVSHALAPDRRVFSPPPFQWPISNNIPRKERRRRKNR